MNTSTLLTYTEAQAILEANKRNNDESIVRWDAGDGFTGEGQWCARRKRIVSVCITSSGFRII